MLLTERNKGRGRLAAGSGLAQANDEEEIKPKNVYEASANAAGMVV
jgi:hypothetical protein